MSKFQQPKYHKLLYFSLVLTVENWEFQKLENRNLKLLGKWLFFSTFYVQKTTLINHGASVLLIVPFVKLGMQMSRITPLVLLAVSFD